MIKRKSEMRYEDRKNLKDGVGSIGMLNLLEKDDTLGKTNICGILTIEPGCSIGLHAHGPDGEIYYILEGELSCTDNGVTDVLYCGDAMFTGDGKTHSVVNNTDKTARMLAVVIA